jgi:orotate phosphoribosyltransferase
VAVAVALASGRRAFSVRKEAKGHGIAGRMAGPVRPGDRVLVVDDAVTTGASTLTAVEALQEFGCQVVAAACLVDRGGELGDKLAALSIPFHPVLGAPDLGYAFGS